MPATEWLTVFPGPRSTELPGDEHHPCKRPGEDDYPAHSWELHTPELRYAVSSLEHWLDLNG